jgi:hypothetical protein
VGKSAEEEGGCDWFEWAEMDEEGENVHPLRNKKRSQKSDAVMSADKEVTIEKVEEVEEGGTVMMGRESI